MAVKVNRKALAVLVVFAAALAGGSIWVLTRTLNKEARARESINEARALAAQGQHEQAAIYYKNAIKNDPENAAVMVELADIYFAQGDMTNAFNYYKSASRKDPANVPILAKLAGFYHLGSQWDDLQKTAAAIVSLSPGGTVEAQSHHYLGQAYFRSRDYVRAAAEFAKAAQMDSTDIDAALALALVNLQQLGAPKEAELALGQLLSRAEDVSLDSEQRADAAVAAAKYYWAAGKYKDAETVLQGAAAIAPAQSRFQVSLGDFYKGRGRDAENVSLAEKAYLRAVEMEPTRATNYLASGIFYKQTGRNEKAIEAFAKAVELTPAALTYQYLVESMMDGGDLAGASGQIKQMRKVKNTATMADYLEGRVLAIESGGKGESFRKAEELFVKVARQTPTFAPVHYQLGLVLAGRGMYDDAAVEFQKTLEIASDFSAAAVALAETYMRSFRYDKAIAEAKNVLARDGRDYYANLTVGRALAAQGSLNSARSFLEQARTVRPTAVDPYIALADVAVREGRFETATALLSDAAANTDEQTKALIAMSKVYFAQGAVDKALQIASQATEAQVEDTRAASYYASLLWQVGRAQDAVDFLARRADQDSGNAPYQNLLGDFQRSMGNADAALAAYRRSLDVSALDRDALSGTAAVLVGQGKYVEARVALGQLRHADPGSPTADMVEAQILEAEGKADAALALLANSLRQNASNSEGYYRLALLQEKRGEMDRAVDNLKNALKFNPGYLAARLALAQLYFQTSFYDDAIREARQVAGSPDASQDTVGRAVTIAMGGLVETQRIDEAITQWSELPPDVRNDGDYLLKLGYLYLVREDYRNAEETFRKAAPLLTDPAGALEGLSRLYLAEKRYEEADASASQALAGATSVAAKVRLLEMGASIAIIQGERDRAIGMLEQMKQASGENAALLVQTGDALASAGDPKGALAAYRAAVAANAAFTPARVRLVNMLLQEGETAEAASMVDVMLRANPLDFDALILKAGALLNEDAKGKAQEAAGLLTRALENAPVSGGQSAEARLMLAKVYYRTGQMSTAESQLRRALSEDSRLTEAKMLLAKVLLAMRAYEDAAYTAGDVLKSDPASAEAYAVLGDAKSLSGDIEEGIANYEKSLSIHKDPAVLMALVTTLDRSGRDDKAISAVEQYAAATPEDATVAKLLATMYEKTGRYAEAEGVLKGILSADASDVANTYALARVYKEEGRLAEAQAILEQSLEDNPTALGYRYLAGIETLAGRRDDAERTLRMAVQRYSDALDVYEDLAALLSTAGKPGEAAAVLRDGVKANAGRQDFCVTLALFFIKSNMQAEAEKFLKETLQAHPDYADAACTLGDLYLSMGNTMEALATYEAAARFAPDSTRATNALAYILAETGGDMARAFKLANAAASRYPDNTGILDTLGWVYYKDHQYANAVATLSRAAELPGGNAPTVLYHLALSYYKVGALARARETTAELLALDASYADKEGISEIIKSGN